MNSRFALVVGWVALILPACREAEVSSPLRLAEVLADGCAAQDVGAILSFVDLNYRDDNGGSGRLEDDLNRLFAVYGQLTVRFQDLKTVPDGIAGRVLVEGRALRFEGSLVLETHQSAQGPLIRSGVFSDLRGIVGVLRERRLAIESGRLDRIEELISPAYESAHEDRQQVLKRLREAPASAEAKAIMVDDLNIQVTGEQALVIQSCLIVNDVGKQPFEKRLREKLNLRKDGTRWRFVGGLG